MKVPAIAQLWIGLHTISLRFHRDFFVFLILILILICSISFRINFQFLNNH